MYFSKLTIDESLALLSQINNKSVVICNSGFFSFFYLLLPRNLEFFELFQLLGLKIHLGFLYFSINLCHLSIVLLFQLLPRYL